MDGSEPTNSGTHGLSLSYSYESQILHYRKNICAWNEPYTWQTPTPTHLDICISMLRVPQQQQCMSMHSHRSALHWSRATIHWGRTISVTRQSLPLKDGLVLYCTQTTHCGMARGVVLPARAAPSTILHGSASSSPNPPPMTSSSECVVDVLGSIPFDQIEIYIQ